MNKPKIYVAKLPLEWENEDMVSFGGISHEVTYPDGAPAHVVFKFNRHLWDQAGRPTEISVAFSTDPRFLAYEPFFNLKRAES